MYLCSSLTTPLPDTFFKKEAFPHSLAAQLPARLILRAQQRTESIRIPWPPPAARGIRGKLNVICTLEVGQHTRTIISSFAKRTVGMLINTGAQDLGFMCLLEEGHGAGERCRMSNEHRG